MRRARNAKIVATLGPSSSDEEKIEELFHAGVDVFRLNFSHGSHEDHQERLFHIRQLQRHVDHPIGVLLDLQGPKLRVGKIEGGEAELIEGNELTLELSEKTGNSESVSLPHPEVFEVLKPGMTLLLDDGKLNLTVMDKKAGRIVTKVKVGGLLRDRKGVNVPGVILPISPITEKDREDLLFGLDLGVDWIALSFVQRREDLIEARNLVGEETALMAKIEKPAALDCLEDLIKLSDGIMVARGDLGVEMPPEVVPGRQKRIIQSCRRAGVPVVVATQMLESMIDSPAPTRAEASDVATAVYDGADAVMLSAETAAGHYPCETVEMMDRIIISAEQDPYYQNIIHMVGSPLQPTTSDAISAAAGQVSNTLSAAAIVCYTMSGSTALRAARERPSAPILVLTNKNETAQKLALLWGAHCVHTADVSNTREMVEKACNIAIQEELAHSGSTLIITAGVPFGTPGTTNLLRIVTLD